MQVLSEQTWAHRDEIAEQFRANQPFRHALISDFLAPEFLAGILREFPQVPEQGLVNEFGQRSRKHAVHEITSLGETFRCWDEFLQSQPFLDYLSSVTGIPDLVFDPEYHGAGTHNNLHGQGMDAHVDFNLHRTTGFHRRLNLIIYLNEGWQEQWGGQLELHKDPWNPDRDWIKSYPPLLNHAVLFETNEYSWHGFEPVNLPEDQRHRSRKSLTVYYYTRERPQQEIASKHGTIYVQKSMPEHLHAGHTLSEEDVTELKARFQRRNNYLKALYGRESALLEAVEEHKGHLARLREEREALRAQSDALREQRDALREQFDSRIQQLQQRFDLPKLGYAEQLGAVTGVLPSMKVTGPLVGRYRAVRALQAVVLCGFVPDFVNGGSNRLVARLDGEVLGEQEVTGAFVWRLPLTIEAEREFVLQVEAESEGSPFDQGLSDDRQAAAYMYRHIEFEVAADAGTVPGDAAG